MVKSKRTIIKSEFAPTPIVINAVKERLKKPDAQKGYIFDGFPRSVEQPRDDGSQYRIRPCY